MTRQRVQSLILAILMALVLVAPEFSVALAQSETPAPTESATQAPSQSGADAPKSKQFKVKFVDAVTGKAIGEVQRVNAGEAATAPDATDHSDLGFQFAGWDRDFSAIKKNLTVTAQYTSVHQIALGDFEAAKASPGGKLHLALPIVFKNATGAEAASNQLAGGKIAEYDAAREIPEYDQSALASQGIEWIRIDLDLGGTPLKAGKSDRSSYVLRSVKDSKKKYGISSGQPVNRGFAAFDAVKAKDNAQSGTYTLKGAIVWRLKGTELDNKVPFEIKLKIGSAPEQTAALDGTAAPQETVAPDNSDILIANQAPKTTPEIQILGSDATPTPEPTVTPEPTATPEATETVEPTATPEATATAEPTATPEITATPEVTEIVEPTATPEASMVPMMAAEFTAEPTAEPLVSATPEATAAAETTEAALALSAKAAIVSKEEGDPTVAPTDGSYTATFTDYDGSTIASTTVQAGYTPSAPGDYVAGTSPIKYISGTWSMFSGWSPDLFAITQNTTFMAQYTALTDLVITSYVDGFNGAALGTDKAEAEAVANSHASLGYKFSGWKEEAAQGDGVINVTATAQYTLTSVITVSPRSFATGKPKGNMTIALPISYAIDSSLAYSDTLAATGKRADKYTGKETDASFDQAQLAALGVQDLYIQLDAFDSSAPVTSSSLSPDYVVEGGVNHGYAVFDGIGVKASATNGYYTLTGKLYWKMTGQKDFSSMTFSTQVRVTGASTSSGGSSYSGGGSTSGTEKPPAKLVVEAITTDPLSPKAGQNFDVVLSLMNTSPDYYVQNVGVTYTADEDALMPTAGSNTIYIAKIDKNASYELRLPVKANPELANENVKIDLAMDYQDKKLTALTASQSVMVKVQQVQRMQLDELQLPATAPTAGDSVQLSVGIFNLGRTALYNVTAKVISDNPNLTPGQAFFGGNMDPGTSKTAELEATPIEAGQYAGTVQVTYENAIGEVTTETRPFTLNVAALEDMNYDESQFDVSMETPAPETPSAAQIMQFLPPWLYAAVGLILLMIILAIAMSARRRRRRMFEDDEMD